MPQVKLDSSRQAVSTAMLVGLNSSCPAGPSVGRRLQHRMRRKQAGQQHDVAEQEKPGAAGDDHGLRGRPAGAASGRRHTTAAVPAAVPERIGIDVPGEALSCRIGRAHAAPPAGAFAASHR